ncbi:DUF2790 domain-containing protein [Pseudomonas sp. MAFF 212408]|uniref:DUF2790 domain-containing protein n=1 Tax=Pseudomonas kitaguniensis TaxID=2607908 RepID=A0A5N7KJJ5_9PSED|nr:DUF2790 domain-containing protein [Pseudomonas kitaguniensis]MPR02386.1 DUF2790 domain-containing protein [Pseudomonas kitaguniensis]
MKGLKVMCACVFLAPALSVANSNHDPIYGDMMRSNQQQVEQYALDDGKPAPRVVHYKYGMKLDVHKVIVMTRADRNCGVAPARMTYEDKSGTLHTVEYKIMGDACTGG